MQELMKLWAKSAFIKALKEGSNSFLEDAASELSKPQLTNLIRILVKVHDKKKRDASVIEVIDVEVIDPKPSNPSKKKVG